jgi:ACT domain-containing protein
MELTHMRSAERLTALLDRAHALPLDEYTKNTVGPLLDLLRERLSLMPMHRVLDSVPGASVVEKTKTVGVSRNTWYRWYRGEVRPNSVQAKRIAALTGIQAEKFQGKR